MVLSMGVPAFAKEYTNSDNSTVNAVADYNLHKTVTTNADSMPNKEFTFNVTNGTQEGTGGETGITAVTSPSLNNSNSITLNANTLTKGSDGYTYTGATTSAIIDASIFNNYDAGIYDYTIKEDGTNDNNWTYDSNTYKMKVKVSKDGNTATIDAITFQGTGDKLDNISFTNNYTVWGHDGGTDNPNTTPTDALTISKVTAGTGSNNTDTFTFTVKFTAADGQDTSKVPYSEAEDGTKTNYVYGDNTITLHGNQSISFAVPSGVTYTVTESSNTLGYNKTEVKVNSGSYTQAMTTGTQTINRTEAQTVTFRNSKVTNVLTGVVNQYGGLIMIVAIAAAGIIVLSIRRRREA